MPAKTNAQKELLAVESGLGVDGLLALAAALTPPGAELLKSAPRPGSRKPVAEPTYLIPPPPAAKR